ncbi:MAG: hypothetical protein LRY51_09295 [Geovibrio sp.]|nr:hypothetical protein [Geovibrio sp.]
MPFKRAAGSPLESILLSLWLNHSAFSGLIERSGLPGHAVRNRYRRTLILNLPPESLNRMAVFASKALPPKNGRGVYMGR